MLPREYAREVFKRGLEYEATLGANPFRFGMIGSTDSHASLATTEENNFFGKATPAEASASPERFTEKFTGFSQQPDGPDITIRHVQSPASGLAGVWATANTRQALFDAMERKEVYATTGTRMTVRVFAGWDFKADEVTGPDFVNAGYARGVPTCGDLSNPSAAATLKFLTRALRDPDGANLDRAQIVKGWRDAAGELHERIFDAIVSDGRRIEADGRCRTPVGNTVNVPTATFTNTIGDAPLAPRRTTTGRSCRRHRAPTPPRPAVRRDLDVVVRTSGSSSGNPTTPRPGCGTA